MGCYECLDTELMEVRVYRDGRTEVDGSFVVSGGSEIDCEQMKPTETPFVL